MGRLIGEMLKDHAQPFIALDTDAGAVAAGRRDGFDVFYGDAGRREMLQHCGVQSTRALIVTMDAPGKVDEVVRAARAVREDLIKPTFVTATIGYGATVIGVGMLGVMALYLGVEMIRDPLTLEPAPEETSAICDRMLELGVIIQPTGDHQNILKTKPPLCIDTAGADFYVDMLDRTLTELF